jgi:hypothetical protein
MVASRADDEFMSNDRFEQFWRVLMWWETESSEREQRMSRQFQDYAHAMRMYEAWTGSPAMLAMGWELYKTVLQMALDKIAPFQKEIERAISRVSGDRRFCRTLNSRLGSVPSNAEAGNKICLLYGGTFPYVIRPCENDQNHFLFVGHCYISGLMYDEGMDFDVEDSAIVLV